ncbi:FAD-binding domain-containing protein [Sphaerulina musiva SO2202]|uniref:FAD-binding domain-containing protein n=1 Tax=Sphaerulina musiva (strain SO2202) TaxID=692275 RepID=N1QDV4_SPHMS|nr:FAD-binding domain-containing protein [Sphaerulina musiva SO2202]EMF10366.1 FAD-binding domain-containing protein [Sphaerulina musiva SO2202]
MQKLTPQDDDYHKVRTDFATADVPALQPHSIFLPRSAAEVAEILKHTRKPGDVVGVRSGGHLFSCSSLIQDGILIDTTHINRTVHYDSATQMVHFGPAARVREISDALCKVGRFFPHGHAPSVAAGGFCLAGGQGMFMHGWGGTAETWIVSMEVVTAAGEIVQASREENGDLFWAARGSGQGFFGVVTRFTCRTMPAKQSLYEIGLTFRVDLRFQELFMLAMARHDAMPKLWTEAAICTFYPDKFERPEAGDGEFDKGALMLSAVATAYADSLEEARLLLSAWEQPVPKALQSLLVSTTALHPVSWKEYFDNQDILGRCHDGKNRWAINSILTDPDIELRDIAAGIESVMCDLPTRTSFGCIYVGDSTPRPGECAFSLPQHLYVSTFTGWTDPQASPDLMKSHMRRLYRQAEKVGCGMYVADYDATDDTENFPVMKERVLEKFLAVREKWDSTGVFPGYKAFIRARKSSPLPGGRSHL